MPRQKQTAEFAAEPRPWQRMPWLAREAHDVVDGEEVGRVAEPCDQLELVLDLGAHLVRHAVRIAPGGALPGQLLEVLLHAHARGRRIDRVVVAQLVQGKAAGVDDLEAACERFRMAAEQARISAGGFRWRSAFASRRKPAWSIVQCSRMQVSTSCSGRRSGTW